MEALVEDMQRVVKTTELEKLESVDERQDSPSPSQHDGEVIREELMDALEKIEILESELQALRSEDPSNDQAEQLAIALNDAVEELTASQSLIKQLQQQLDQSRHVIALNADSSSRPNNDLIEELAFSRSKITDMAQILTESVDKIAALEAAKSASADEIRKLQQEKAATDKEIENMMAQVATLTKQCQDLMLAGSSFQSLQGESSTDSIKPTETATSLQELGLQEVDDVDSLKAELLTAKSDIARLQFANHSMNDKITELEKQPGKKAPPGAVLKRGAKLFTQSCQTDEYTTPATQQETEQTVSERNAIISSLQEEIKTLSESLIEARKLQHKENEDTSVNALVMAKTKLQERCASLQDDLEMTQESLAINKSELTRVCAENKTLVERIGKLEKVLVKKMPAAAAASTAVEDGLKREVSFLVNENLSMRELAENLEKQLKQLTLDNSKLQESLLAAQNGIIHSTAEVIVADAASEPLAASNKSYIGYFKVCVHDDYLNIIIIRI